MKMSVGFLNTVWAALSVKCSFRTFLHPAGYAALSLGLVLAIRMEGGLMMATDGQRRLADLPIGPAGVEHHGGPTANGKRRLARVNLDESPLGWLFARDLITARQFDAGEALRRDYEAAAMAPSITMGWERLAMGRVDGGRIADLTPTERQTAARVRFDNAMAALGAGLSDIAWRVLCAGEAIGAAEKGLGWPTRSAKLVLTLALDRLADYYRVR
jgi:Domain of unknown function (DUF6456)